MTIVDKLLEDNDKEVIIALYERGDTIEEIEEQLEVSEELIDIVIKEQNNARKKN